jgi:predicted transcriptional regulator
VKKSTHSNLARRERQVMDILYRRGEAAVGEIMEELPGEPSYSAVRGLLRVLEQKGHVRHVEKQLRYVYLPKVPLGTVRQSALRHLVDTFFEGSRGKVMAALIGDERTELSKAELDELAEMIEKARKGAQS